MSDRGKVTNWINQHFFGESSQSNTAENIQNNTVTDSNGNLAESEPTVILSSQSLSSDLDSVISSSLSSWHSESSNCPCRRSPNKVNFFLHERLKNKNKKSHEC